jgi:hypothetical protein
MLLWSNNVIDPHELTATWCKLLGVKRTLGGRRNPPRRVARFANRTFKSHRGASFRVVPHAPWYAPCVMAADNESDDDNDGE